MTRFSSSSLFLLLISVNCYAQETWIIDPVHSSVQFEVTHLAVSSVTGSFSSFSGTVTTKNNSFEGAEINAVINVPSITTNNMERDKHLKEDDFFNAKKYPQIQFKSSSFKKIGNGDYVIDGILTIRDVSKPIKLKTTFGGLVSIEGQQKAGFSASGMVNRFDYGLRWDDVLDTGGLVVGEEVDIILKMELIKQ